MTKSDLVNAIAEKAGITKKDAEKTLSVVLDTIVDTLAQGDKIQLVGFGSFEVRERAARMGKNPQTGEAMQIEASKSPVFKAGKAFKDAVNK